MSDNTEEVKQNNTVSTPVVRIGKFALIIKKINKKTAIIVSTIIIAGVLGYFYKGLLVAATVNGSPISRFAVIGELEKTSGKQALESLITRRLIISELNKENITVTNDEINTEIKKIEDRIVGSGGTLEQALEGQNMTMAELKEQISINLRMSKVFADKLQVTDEEITKYIKDNKLTTVKGQEAQLNDQATNQIKSSKFSQAASVWVSSLQANASINYFVNY